jgi:hypothetical protein
MNRYFGRRPCEALVVSLLFAAACGDDPAAPDAGNSRMSARVDGTAWTSDPLPASDVVILALPGVYQIDGRRIAGGNSSAMTITLYNVRGPGTYPLGVGPTGVGGLAQYVEAGRGWATPLSGASGSITVSTLSETAIAGTFFFTGEAITGGATGTRSVTEGRFDFPVRSNGNVGPLPDNAGSRIGATIRGSAWNAATVAASAPVANLLAISASNTFHTVSISLSGISGPGTYPLSSSAPSRSISVFGPAMDPQGSNCCWGPAPGSTGAVTITTRTATRVAGTFSANLQPLPGSSAAAPLVITNGTFDIGLP